VNSMLMRYGSYSTGFFYLFASFISTNQIPICSIFMMQGFVVLPKMFVNDFHNQLSSFVTFVDT